MMALLQGKIWPKCLMVFCVFGCVLVPRLGCPLLRYPTVAEPKAGEATSASHEGVPAVPAASGDEELVNYQASPECSNMEINVVRFSKEYYAISEKAEEMAHLDFGLHEAVF